MSRSQKLLESADCDSHFEALLFMVAAVVMVLIAGWGIMRLVGL